ncbi:MAG: hypothetical protein ACP5I3_12100, partial [Thermoproteus sp.]
MVARKIAKLAGFRDASAGVRRLEAGLLSHRRIHIAVRDGWIYRASSDAYSPVPAEELESALRRAAPGWRLRTERRIGKCRDEQLFVTAELAEGRVVYSLVLYTSDDGETGIRLWFLVRIDAPGRPVVYASRRSVKHVGEVEERVREALQLLPAARKAVEALKKTQVYEPRLSRKEFLQFLAAASAVGRSGLAYLAALKDRRRAREAFEAAMRGEPLSFSQHPGQQVIKDGRGPPRVEEKDGRGLAGPARGGPRHEEEAGGAGRRLAGAPRGVHGGRAGGRRDRAVDGREAVGQG